MNGTEQKIREQVTTSLAERMAEYTGMSAVALRKAAAGLGLKGASRGRKAELLTQILHLIRPQIESDVRAAYAAHAKVIEEFGPGTRVETPKDGFGRIDGEPVFTPTGYVVTVVFEDKNVTPSGGADYAVKNLKVAAEAASDALDEIIERQDAALDVETDAVPEPAPKRTKKASRTKAAKCEVCGARPVDKKTQGRDSTLCTECYEYAGWENQHSDDAHEQGREEGLSFPGCPICESVVGMIAHKKARWVAETAKAAGWSVDYSFDGAANETTLKLSRDGADITLVWEGRLYVAKRSDFRDPSGRRQLRNASAAVKAVRTPSKADKAMAS